MILKILHLNVERNRHLDSVFKLIQQEKPDLVCLEEAMHTKVKEIASKLKYNLAFAPLIIIQEDSEEDAQGPAILSKLPIVNIKKYRYNDNPQESIPVRTINNIISHKGKRPQDRFSYTYTLLSIEIKLSDGLTLTLATTHFPVVDHASPGLTDHQLDNLQDIKELEHSDIFLQRLISKLRILKNPLIFTADLNNSRGEYIYDSLANELIDIVPESVLSTIDPKLHRRSWLKLVVDTIMISPDISVEDFKLMENVSDHKALISRLKI